MQTIEVHPDGGRADAAVIVLHGLGADGTDFLPFADEIDLSAIGAVRWLLPRAPVRPVTINNGYRMRAWYDIYGAELEGGGAARSRREDNAGLRESFADVHRLIEREIARGVPARRIVLAGFSQGCAVTLGAGLRCPHRLAGLAGMSGYLPLASALAAERHAANAGVPIFLAHGTQDDVVVPDRGTASRDALQALGWPVEWHTYPMQHSVCIEEVQDLQAWLLRVLA
ncbi:MAG: prolyl oligopeptidase family serine peptidase [Rubrivivax sp.]|nr:prolyl oligopeptidase family serine peptidase [Rubrivivax sp.]